MTRFYSAIQLKKKIASHTPEYILCYCNYSRLYQFHTHAVCTIRGAVCKAWVYVEAARAVSVSQRDQKWASAQLSDELHWYNGCFNPSQLDPQGTGSGCFHTARICTGGGRTDWQAAVWTLRDRIGYNSRSTVRECGRHRFHGKQSVGVSITEKFFLLQKWFSEFSLVGPMTEKFSLTLNMSVSLFF